MFVSGIVIHDQMQLFMLRRSIVHQSQEVDPLLMAMPLLAQTDHFSIQSIESGKQRRSAIALVIVGHRTRATTLQLQTRLRAVESLNLTLLIAAPHQGVLGWIEIKTYHRLQLFGEVRI